MVNKLYMEEFQEKGIQAAEVAFDTTSYENSDESDLSWISASDVIAGRDPKKPQHRKVLFALIATVIILVVSLASLGIGYAAGDGQLGNNTNNLEEDTDREDYVLRINPGAFVPYVDDDRNVWLPDFHNDTDELFQIVGDSEVYNVCPTPIKEVGAAGEQLYCTERFFKSDEGGYDIFVPDSGVYKMYLHFADITYSSPNDRKFDISINDIVEFEDVDIVGLKGRGSTALRLEAEATVTDTTIIRLRFHQEIEHPQINGIEVHFVSQIRDYSD